MLMSCKDDVFIKPLVLLTSERTLIQQDDDFVPKSSHRVVTNMDFHILSLVKVSTKGSLKIRYIRTFH